MHSLDQNSKKVQASAKPSYEKLDSVQPTLSNCTTVFRAGVNTDFIGKTGASQLSGAAAWQTIELSGMAELAAHIGRGYPWMPGDLGGQKRLQANVSGADVLALDIDGGLSIEEAIADPFISRYAGLGIESSSSKPERHKFRLIFRLPERLSDPKQIKRCTEHLINQVPAADRACKDAGRYFFGAQGRKAFLLNDGASLPLNFIEAAFEKRDSVVSNGNRSYISPGTDYQIIRSALAEVPTYIPGGGTYPDLLAMMAGVLNELGAEGKQLLIAWDGGVGEWGTDFGHKLDGLMAERGKATLGSLFWLAGQHGWKRPDLVSTAGNDLYLQAGSGHADWVCPTGQKYLGGIPFPADARFIAIRAPKGTGKTQEIERLVSEARTKGQRVLLINHRVQLALALAERVGISSIYQILQEESDREIFEGYGLCIQSLHPASQAHFEAQHWENALVILDECEQVIWEMLSSSTCKSNRVAILREFKALITAVLAPEGSGRLVVADADLSDLSIGLITGISGAAKPWTAISDYKESGSEVTSYERPEMLLQRAEDCLDAGERLLTVTDSQKGKSKYGSSALEKRWRKKYPHLKILRIDSDTLHRKDTAAFGRMDSLNELIAGYDIVIMSPSVETGVSLDLKGHFSRVIGFFAGVMAANSVRQALARLRESVPREVYIAPRGLSLIGGGLTDAGQIERSDNKHVSAAMTLIFEAARKEDIDSNFLPVAIHAFSRFAARHNAGMHDYRSIIHANLEEEGHTLSFVLKPDKGSDQAAINKSLSNQLSAERTHALEAEGAAIANAEDLDLFTIAELDRKNSVDDETQSLALKKAHLKRLYPGHEITPDLFILDQFGWFPKVRLHYYLAAGREFLKARDTKKVEALLNGNAVWGQDLKRATLSLKVAALEAFKIPELLELETISNEHPALIELDRAARQQKWLLKQIFKFSISDDDSPVVTARKFLSVIGFRLGKATRQGARGEEVRHYPIELEDFKFLGDLVVSAGNRSYLSPGTDDGEFNRQAKRFEADRLLIFESWLERDQPDEDSEEFWLNELDDIEAISIDA